MKGPLFHYPPLSSKCSSLPPGELPTLPQLGFSDASLRRAATDAAAAGGGLAGGERRALQGMQVCVSALALSVL